MAILHLVAAETWATWPAGEPFAPASLASEGFVHCTGDLATLVAVANAFYRDEPGEMVVVELDERRLSSEVRWEEPSPAPPPGVGRDVRFPHVFGPLDQQAVVSVRPLARRPDGSYLDAT